MVLHLSSSDFADLEAKAQQEIETKDHPRITRFAKINDRQGIIETPDATVEYFYDPSFERLAISVGKLHSLAAKIAPHQVLDSHIMEVIHSLEPLAKQEDVPDSVVGGTPAPQDLLTNPVLQPLPPSRQSTFVIKPPIKKEGV